MTKVLKKVYSSLAEFKRDLFPKDILSRLEEDLCSALGLEENYQHRLTKTSKDSREGILELARPMGPFSMDKEQLEERIKKFYAVEGYNITEPLFIQVQNKNDNYRILVLENATSWIVSVNRS